MEPVTIMLGAFVRENPLLAAIAGTVLRPSWSCSPGP